MDVNAATLVDLERRYAPSVGRLPGLFSPVEIERTGDGNAGGDKMAPDRNGYAEVYAQLLEGFDPQHVVELGVFQGVSLAIWCDLFPDAHVVGLDLEFGRFDTHRPFLTAQGAFNVNSPSLVKFDAYSSDLPDLHMIDLFVDDGPHTEPAIRNCLSLFAPRMAPGGIYVVEDFDGGDRLLAEVFPQGRLVRAGRLNAVCL